MGKKKKGSKANIGFNITYGTVFLLRPKVCHTAFGWVVRMTETLALSSSTSYDEFLSTP